jgi:Zn-dependent protease
MTQPVSSQKCPRCGQDVAPADLECPRCGALAYGPVLERLAAEAQMLEPIDPAAAARLWQQSLRLLPPDSKQHSMIAARLRQIAARAPTTPGNAGAPSPKTETWQSAVFKTGGSMLLSILAYQWYAGWGFAVGLVLLILVHELGHVVANWHYQIRSSPPIFIPFLGAVISLRQQFPNAKVEAVSAIAGPLAGTFAAMAPLAWYMTTGDRLALVLAAFGFMINLFNMLPVPPLDGGRVMAGVSPWVWLLGLVGLGALVVNDFRKGQDISILMILLILALPRIIATLRGPARAGPYYQIGRATQFSIGLVYLALLLFLVAMSWYLKHKGAPTFL